MQRTKDSKRGPSSRCTWILCIAVVFVSGPALADTTSESPGKLLNQAQRLEAEKNYPKAIILYRRFLELRPENDEVRASLARLLSWQKDYDRAVTLYHEILSRHPADLDVRVALARVKSWQGKLGEAIGIYREVLRQRRDHIEARRGLADSLYWSGAYRQALTEYRQAYRMVPDPEIGQRIASVEAELRENALRHSNRVPIGALGFGKRRGFALPYRSYVKLGYGYYAYTDDIDNEQAGLIEAAAPLGARTAIGRVETINRFGATDMLLSGELYSPLWRAASGYAGFSAGIGVEFVPEWTLGGELYQGLGLFHPALRPIEISFGYRRLTFEAQSVDVLIPGITFYLPYDVFLTEKLYFVPETDSKTLSSQLTWRITDRIQIFASGAFGTAGERLSIVDDISRVDTVGLQLGVSLPLAQQLSMEAIGTYEDRDASYTRGGLAVNLLYHW
ncbi:MAG: YaiO family outer membrane beta-barrel protein [Gammaproteobacteria bacterium]